LLISLFDAFIDVSYRELHEFVSIERLTAFREFSVWMISVYYAVCRPETGGSWVLCKREGLGGMQNQRWLRRRRRR